MRGLEIDKEGAGSPGRGLVHVLVMAAIPMLLALTSCGDGAALPGRPTVMQVTMSEYRFDFQPPSQAGRVVVDLANTGHLNHDLVLAEVPAGTPALTYNPRSPRREALPTLLSVRPLPPGTRDSLAVDLSPGTYVVLCFVRDSDGSPHIFKGMHSQFRV